METAFADVVLTERFGCPPLASNTSAANGRWPIQRTHTQWHATDADSSSTHHTHTPASHIGVRPG